jgi:hypothetical protein
LTSQDRREKRYHRRKAARQAKRIAASQACGNFESVFSYSNLYAAGKKCARGVGWKASTQTYLAKLPTNTYKLHKALHSGKYKSKGFFEFTLTERGKRRKIKSVHISERVVQKTLCDNVLTPIFNRSLIYDNGASRMCKGMDFALDRLTCHLQRHYRKHGAAGYILLIDFANYFESIPHGLIYAENAKRIHDNRIRAIADSFCADFGERGLGLGSQVSQVYALTAASPVDYFCKQVLRIKGYARYMDDCYLIHHSREYLTQCKAAIAAKCAALGLTVNLHKTVIRPLSRFKFLQTRFSLSEMGRVYLRMNPKSTYRCRRKLRLFKGWLDRGKMTLRDAQAILHSYIGHFQRGDSYHAIRRMTALYNSIYA